MAGKQNNKGDKTNHNDSSSTEANPLQCSLCSSRHKDPRLLTCFHSFCRQCLENHIQKKKFKLTFPCPLCGIEIGIPKAGPKALPENYYIRAIHASAAFSTISTCDTCSSALSEAKARCLECETNYCDKCSIKHLDIEANKEHHIVGLNKPHDKHFTNVTHKSFCVKHKSEETVYYCLLCEMPVCKECVSKVSDHKGHKYKSISEGAKDKREAMTPILKSMHEYLPYLTEYMQDMRVNKQLVTSYATETISQVKSRCRLLQAEIEKISQVLITEVEEKRDEETGRIEEHLTEVELCHKSLSATTTATEDILSLANDSEVINVSGKLYRRFKRVSEEIPSSGLTECISNNFRDGDLGGKTLYEMFGFVDDTNMKMPLVPIPWGLRMALTFDVQLLTSFRVQDGVDTIHAIAPTPEQEAWVVCGWGQTQMHLWGMDGKKKNTQSLDIQIDDICVNHLGELLVSSYDAKKILKVDRKMNKSVFATLNWYPGGMTFSKKRKELFVCAVDSYVTTRSSASRRMVIRISKDGEVLDQIEDNGFQEVFCAPYRIYENMIGDICVSDREENNVRVTSLNLEGILKNTYCGPSEVALKKPFNPFGVVSDRYGHILVSDWSNNSIHLLDLSGQFVGFLLTEKDGLKGPNALALDNEGHLWVGDTKSTVWVYKYNRKTDRQDAAKLAADSDLM